MDNYNKKVGKIGENIAFAYYKNVKKYKIIGRNVFFKGGELDMIAENGNTVYFIEVKTVQEGKIDAVDNFTSQKAKNMKRAIELYMHMTKKLDFQIQIDLVCVELKKTFNFQKKIEIKDFKIDIFENIILD